MENSTSSENKNDASASDAISLECKNNSLLTFYRDKINQNQPFDMQEALLKIVRNADVKLIPSTLDIGERGGTTDYIDFIRPNEMKSSVMYGIDYLQRPFVSYLLHFEPMIQVNKPNDKERHLIMSRLYSNVIRMQSDGHTQLHMENNELIFSKVLRTRLNF